MQRDEKDIQQSQDSTPTFDASVTVDLRKWLLFIKPLHLQNQDFKGIFATERGFLQQIIKQKLGL